VVQQVVVAAAALDASQHRAKTRTSAAPVSKNVRNAKLNRETVSAANVNSVNKKVTMLTNVVPKNKLVRNVRRRNDSGNKENVNAQKRLDVQQRKETSSLV
jgi:hypothetical protein